MTTNSLNRRSPKRKDISEEALLEAITDILPYIRVNHIIPRSSVILQSAYHRNLLSKPFPLDVGSSNDIDRNTSLYWVREINGRRHHGYTRPRLFLPYFEEAKVSLVLFFLLMHHIGFYFACVN